MWTNSKIGVDCVEGGGRERTRGWTLKSPFLGPLGRSWMGLGAPWRSGNAYTLLPPPPPHAIAYITTLLAFCNNKIERHLGSSVIEPNILASSDELLVRSYHELGSYTPLQHNWTVSAVCGHLLGCLVHFAGLWVVHMHMRILTLLC